VDGSQSVGCVKVDVLEEQVDVLSGIPYKWLTGPNGVGFFYIREALIPSIAPDRFGWSSIDGFGSLETLESNPLHTTAKRYEYGTLGFEAIYALDAALDYFNRIGVEQIERRNLQLIDKARVGLQEKGYRFFTPADNRAPILSFYVDDEQALAAQMKKRGFHITARRWREGYIRISPHFYNSDQEIDAFLYELPNCGD
jgi:selenocysteine lyase/cysteine desulfurase